MRDKAVDAASGTVVDRILSGASCIAPAGRRTEGASSSTLPDNPTGAVETECIESLRPEREGNDLRDWLACREPLPTQDISRTMIA
jgi:hypothetical protein